MVVGGGGMSGESPDTLPAIGYVLQAFYLKKLVMCLQVVFFGRF
jgi:hypothetical protein